MLQKCTCTWTSIGVTCQAERIEISRVGRELVGKRRDWFWVTADGENGRHLRHVGPGRVASGHFEDCATDAPIIKKKHMVIYFGLFFLDFIVISKWFWKKYYQHFTQYQNKTLNLDIFFSCMLNIVAARLICSLDHVTTTITDRYLCNKVFVVYKYCIMF